MTYDVPWVPRGVDRHFGSRDQQFLKRMPPKRGRKRAIASLGSPEAPIDLSTDAVSDSFRKTDRKARRHHPDSLQSLFNKTAPASAVDLFSSSEQLDKPVKCAKVTPEDRIDTDASLYVEDDSQERFTELVSFCSHWMPFPTSIQYRLDREISSLTLSSVIIQKTPKHVLRAKPIMNLDFQLHFRLEFASFYAVSLYDFFNEQEVRLQLADADYLAERHKKASPDARQKPARGRAPVQAAPAPVPVPVPAPAPAAKGKKGKTKAKAKPLATVSQLIGTAVSAPVSPVSGPDAKITADLRSLAVELVVTFASQECTALSETLHMAVNIMDRFFAARLTQRVERRVGSSGFSPNFTSGVRHTPIEAANVLYVAMAALSLAWKYEEKFRADVMDRAVPAVVGWYQILKGGKKGAAVQDLQSTIEFATKENTRNKHFRREPSPPSPSEFTYQVSIPTPIYRNPLRSRPIGLAAEAQEPVRTHVLAEIISMELEILETLQWQVRVPTAQTFLKRYMMAGQLTMRQCLIATCLCDRMLLSYALLKYLPSLVASAAVSMVRLLFHLDGWSSTLEHFTGYQQSDLDDCILSIQSALLAEEVALFNAAETTRGAALNSIGSSSELLFAEPTGLGKRKASGTRASMVAGGGGGGGAARTGAGQKPSVCPYIPGASIRAKYKDEIYRSLLNLPVTWTKSGGARAGGAVAQELGGRGGASSGGSASGPTSVSLTPLSSNSLSQISLSIGL